MRRKPGAERRWMVQIFSGSCRSSLGALFGKRSALRGYLKAGVPVIERQSAVRLKSVRLQECGQQNPVRIQVVTRTKMVRPGQCLESLPGRFLLFVLPHRTMQKGVII